MKLEDFISKRTKELETFAINMKNLGIPDQSEEKWMQTYLDWNEWTSPLMHDLMWKTDILLFVEWNSEKS